MDPASPSFTSSCCSFRPPALWFTFARNASDADIRAGHYDNIRFLPSQQRDPTNSSGNWIVPERGPSGSCMQHGRGAGVWCQGKDLVDRPFRPEQGESDLWEVEALCWYTAAYLTDLMRSRGETPPPLGFIATPEGGTTVEQWTEFATQAQCANMTCMCSTPHCNQSQPLDPDICWGNGGLYRANIEPYVNTTIKGWWWWQGENNEGTDGGTVLENTGYACAFSKMVAQWRSVWSAAPGTTDPLAPFGFVTIADGTEEGWGLNAGGLHWAQTANYGQVPNPALPNAFSALAHDAGDPWDADGSAGGCGGYQCCVDAYVPLGAKCVGDHRGEWSINGTGGFMGYLHPRTKDTVARRLAQATYATVYAPASGVLASGPVLAGCTVAGTTLTLAFDQARLQGETVVVSKPPGAQPLALALENTATYVLVNSTLDVAAAARNHHGPDPGAYKGTYSAGNELGYDSWVAVLPVAGPGGNTVTLDLAPLRGATPTAVRYAWGAGGWGITAPDNGGCGRMCCGPTVDCRVQPCPPDSCPIHASGVGGLPAVPFVAAITATGKCQCLPPQKCDA